MKIKVLHSPIVYLNLFLFLINPFLMYAGDHDSRMSSINQYFYNMKYDRRSLLATLTEGSNESLPSKRLTENGVIVCSTKKKELSADFKEISILSPTAGKLMVGDIVRANEDLANGNPSLVSLDRSPITISLDLPGLKEKGSMLIKNPTFSSVQAGIQSIFEDWADSSANDYKTQAKMTYTSSNIYNKFQGSAELGFNLEWASGEISSKLDFSATSTSSRVLAMYKQVYYTVTIDKKSSPASYFAPNVTLEDIMTNSNENNPLAIVSDIDMGKIIIVEMNTSSMDTRSNLEAALDYAANGTKVGAEMKAKFESIIENASFKVFVLGGSSEVATQIIANPTNLKEIIQKNAEVSKTNPGHPIAYRTLFLKDNQPATMNYTTDYNETECKQYTNGYIKLKNNAGYVANFIVSYDDGDNKVVHNFNYKTVGWSTTVTNIPGDAKNLKVYSEGYDFFGIKSETFNEILSGPNNKCYVAGGTTFMHSYYKTSNIDCSPEK